MSWSRNRSLFIAGIIALLCSLLFTGILALAVQEDGSLRYNSLDYTTRVLANGDLQITQVVDIDMRKHEDDDETVPWKQMYQQYQLAPGNLTNITDVSVRNLDTGDQYTHGDFTITPSLVDSGTWNQEYAGQWYMAEVYDTYPVENYDPSRDGISMGTSYFDNLNEPGSLHEEPAKIIEIGWNIPATIENHHARFQIEMTFVGVATAYDDVTALKWEPFGKKNELAINHVHGVLTLPQTSSGTPDARTWVHTTANAQVEQRANEVEFTLERVRKGQYLDIVAMMDNAVTTGVERQASGHLRDRLIASEDNERTAWDRDQQRRRQIRLAIWMSIVVAGVALGIAGLRVGLRVRRQSRYHGPMEYWREPPAMSPGAAARLYTYTADRTIPTSLDTRALSATMLSLVSKGAIAVYPGAASVFVGIDLSNPDNAPLIRDVAMQSRSRNDKSNQTYTVVVMPAAFTPQESGLNLCSSEQAALDLLMDVYQRVHSPVFDLKQMKKALRNQTTAQAIVNAFDDACTQELDALHALQRAPSAVSILGACEMIVGIASCVYFLIGAHNLLLALVISVPILTVSALIFDCHRIYIINPEHEIYAGQVQGLARYMQDFSTFKDRGVLDLALWDRYLVYAAAFGLSKRVVEQLRAAYPELNDTAWVNTYVSYSSVLYWSSGSLGNLDNSSFGFTSGLSDFGSQLSSDLSSVTSTISSSSSSGGSFGGSSGGSGGGSFGGR